MIDMKICKREQEEEKDKKIKIHLASNTKH